MFTIEIINITRIYNDRITANIFEKNIKNLLKMYTIVLIEWILQLWNLLMKFIFLVNITFYYAYKFIFIQFFY